MGKYIDSKYGAGTADKLEMKARNKTKIITFELEEMEKKYKKLVQKWNK